MKWLLLVFIFSHAYAQNLRSFYNSNTSPLKTLKEVHQLGESETVLRLRNAEVVVADYGLIRRDFPAISHLSDSQIDDWLIRHTGFISVDQQAQTIVNSAIEVTEETAKGYRPPEYGRALVYEALDEKGKAIGVLDVKGAGGIKPSHASHRSGTMTLGESLREFSFEKMMTRVIDHSGIENKVVGSYAVIYPGFDVIHADGSRAPAGFYLRQGHKRLTQAETANSFQPRGNGWMDQKWRQRYGDLLEQYGVFANTNYQGTVQNDLFDFGHYIIREDMKVTNSKLAIPFEKWGFDLADGAEIFTSDDRWRMSKMDRPWNWSHDVADAYVSRKIGRHEVWMHHYNLVEPVDKKLAQTPRHYGAAKKLGFKIRVCEQAYNLRATGR